MGNQLVTKQSSAWLHSFRAMKRIKVAVKMMPGTLRGNYGEAMRVGHGQIV